MSKKCQSCGKEDARNHFKKWENNRETELLLCDSCAEERGLIANGEQGDIQQSLNIMLQDMDGLSEGAVGTIKCDACGLVYSTFRDTGTHSSACAPNSMPPPNPRPFPPSTASTRFATSPHLLVETLFANCS